MPQSKPSKAEQKATIDSMDVGMFDDSPLPILDRSALERAADCPFQAHAVANKLVVDSSAAADSGNAVHEAYSQAVREWIDSDGTIEPHDLRASIEHDLANSRPDIQPDVMQGGRASIWAFVAFLQTVHPDNILAFDGGEQIGRGGQLAWDMPDLGVRVTSEIDLLLAGDSAEVVEEVDYKSGWKDWTATLVKRSFQFQMHAALILRAFPAIKAVNTSIWMTRTNERTFRVEFNRKYLNDYECRIRQGVIAWRSSLEHPPTWPTYEKCALCPAAVLCPEASADIRDVAADPGAALKQLIAIDAKREKLATLLEKHVDQTRQEIIVGTDAFGRQKPKASRKAPAVVYQVTSNPEGE